MKHTGNPTSPARQPINEVMESFERESFEPICSHRTWLDPIASGKIAIAPSVLLPTCFVFFLPGASIPNKFLQTFRMRRKQTEQACIRHQVTPVSPASRAPNGKYEHLRRWSSSAFPVTMSRRWITDSYAFAGLETLGPRRQCRSSWVVARREAAEYGQTAVVSSTPLASVTGAEILLSGGLPQTSPSRSAPCSP